MRIVQLSDLHFGTEVEAVVSALLVRLTQLQPDLLLLSGDLTQRARRREFARCRRFLQQLPEVPILAVPGNHDLPLYNIWHRFRAPYAGFRRVFGHELAPCFESESMLVVGVNTTDPRRHVDGAFEPAAIEQVAQRLATSSAPLKLVVGHHPMDAVLVSDEQNIARQAGAAVRAWAAAGMQLYLAGHIHFPFFAPLNRRYPGVPDDIWTLQAGTAISRRTRDGKPNSFNMIEREQQQLALTRWDYQAPRGAFEQAEQVQLPLRSLVSSSDVGSGSV